MNGMRKFTTTYYKLSSNGKFPEGNGFRLAFISDLHNMELSSSAETRLWQSRGRTSTRV